jgi:TRIAP1/MDM35 family protein
MAHSLSPECTPLKHEYDACFNTWFEGYLEPAIANANTKGHSQDQRIEYSKLKKEEYDRKCGSIWEKYKDCVQVSTSSFLYITGNDFSSNIQFNSLDRLLVRYLFIVTVTEIDADIFQHRKPSQRKVWVNY